MQLSPSLSLAANLRVWRTCGLLFCIGGAFWIAHYAIQLAFGFATGHAPTRNLLDGFCFAAAIALLCAALLITNLRLRLSGGAWSVVGAVFAALAGVSAAFGFILGATGAGAPGLFGGIGVIGSCLSATFTALAARRAQIWPSRLSTLLLVIGLLTFPLILAFWPFNQFVPAFLTDELPFALSGAGYFVLGRTLVSLDSSPLP